MTLHPISGKSYFLLFALLVVSAFAAAQTAVPVVLAPVPQLQFFDQSGRPLAFGCVSTFASQTTNPLATFTDFTGQFANPNPVILSAGGSANIWLQSGQAYSLTVKSSGGTNCSLGQTLYTVDGVGGGASQLNTVVTPSGGSAAFTVQSQNQLFSLTLTGNVAGSPVSFIGVIAPALVTFQITEDGAGAHTFSWPSNVTGAAPIDTTALHVTSQTFLWNGTTIMPVGSGFTSQGNSLLPGNVNTLGTVTAPSYNGIISVEGSKYALNATGLQQAIADSIASGTREVHVCGTIPITSTTTLTTGGVSIIGCGSGGINNSLVPTAMLQWTGAAGSDLLQITGQASPRMDKVKLQNLILDGGGTARYDLRMEKVDIVSLYDVRFRNAATAGMYAVDSTGIEGINVNCGTIASYCMVLDWGTGGSIFTGLQVENDVSSTLPLILLQGASRGITFNGFQCDGTNTSFGGCIQITGFDANSSFASAPAGGAGAPQSVKITNPDVTIHAAATTPSQGADILITGTATNQSSHISIEGLNDLGGTVSASAVKIDQANDIEIKGGISSSHTAASLNITANAAKVRRFFFQSFSDTASCTGTGCATLSTIDESSTGGLIFGTGFGNDSAAFKHKRFGATCTTTTTIGNSCTTTFSWTTAFADANYTPVCSGTGPANGPTFAIDSFNAAGVTVRVATIVALASGYNGVDCVAVHD